jgi:hypothetical protein
VAGISAAAVGDVDLDAVARVNPAAAKEIARIGELMRLGEESDEEFLALIQLLHGVGEVAKAEHLLRRNLDLDTDGHLLYLTLFGRAKEEEFRASILAFERQFGVELRFEERPQFLVERYRSNPTTSRAAVFPLLTRPCHIQFGYTDRERIHADVVLLDPNRVAFKPHECLLLHWCNEWQAVVPDAERYSVRSPGR